MTNKKRDKNKGFSLIELIVVVAIMAVLVGVLAPAYLRYVEKSRRQTCYYNMDNVVGEIKLLAYSDPDFAIEIADAATSPSTNILSFIDTATDVFIPDCPSNGEYEITFNEATGIVSMTCSMEVHGLPSEEEITPGEGNNP